ncbi:MAG: MBL fold metallo-hydrolase [Candidatus Brocadiales bacterium]
MKKLFLLQLLISSILWGNIAHATGEVTIKWFGHSCFLIESSQGTKVLTDPLGEETGYNVPDVMPDIITISHEHFDHNYVRPYKDLPIVLRGEDSHGRDWQMVEETIKDVSIYNVGTYHDDLRGKRDGKNSAFVFIVDRLRIVHLGDLGHLLSEEQIEAIGTPDILFIPTGGVSTIDYEEAAAVVGQLKPRITIPMHFKTAACKFTLFRANRFIRGKNNTQIISGNTLVVSKDTLPNKPKIVVLHYK